MRKEDVVKRLKATLEYGREEDDNMGKESGRYWAQEHATAKQLRRIGNWIKLFAQEKWWDNQVLSGRHLLAAAVLLNIDADDAKEAFWADIFGHDYAACIDDDDFFHGFGDGVYQVWDEVAAHL
jgi:hypothetical protein